MRLPGPKEGGPYPDDGRSLLYGDLEVAGHPHGEVRHIHPLEAGPADLVPKEAQRPEMGPVRLRLSNQGRHGHKTTKAHPFEPTAGFG